MLAAREQLDGAPGLTMQVLRLHPLSSHDKGTSMARLSSGLCAWVTLLSTIAAVPLSRAQTNEPQAPRAQSPQDFRLDELPHYKAAHRVSGTIRNFGSGLNGLLALWEEGFRKI